MNVMVNSNTLLKDAVRRKWPSDEQKEWWYVKLAEARRAKLLRCSEQQNHRCCYCGSKTWHPFYGETGSKRLLATLEHVVPRSMGGTDSMNNLTMACSRCNSTRGDCFEAEVFYEMIKNGANLRRPTNKTKNLELLAKKAVDKTRRTETLLASAAFTLTSLDLWWWFDYWLAHGSSYMGDL